MKRSDNVSVDELAGLNFYDGFALEGPIPLGVAVFFFVSRKMYDMIPGVKTLSRMNEGDNAALYEFMDKQNLLDLKRSWGYFTNNPTLIRRTETELSTLLCDEMHYQIQHKSASSVSPTGKLATEQSSCRPLELQVQYRPNT